jgi:outer membrane translocation and assembly module TamA
MDDVRPLGWQGATYSFLELGYIKERRDNEFRSQNGYLASISFKISLPLISETIIGQLYSEFRWFREITKTEQIPRVIFAQRFLVNQTFGDIPYWFAPSLGGGGSVRGFIYRRYVGNGLMQSNTELRSWLIKLPWFESRLGMNLFWDNGAVYDQSLKNWQRASTAGFGGFMSLFSQDYILKYEMGFSEEGVGIYIGSGFSF